MPRLPEPDRAGFVGAAARPPAVSRGAGRRRMARRDHHVSGRFPPHSPAIQHDGKKDGRR